MPSKPKKNKQEIPPESGPSNATTSDVRAALKQLRQKLLDLTARNPLISFRHGKSTRYIRIVDELPNKLTELLFSRKSLTFSPVPVPNLEGLNLWQDGLPGSTLSKRPPVEESAKRMGINISLDLPEQTEGGASPRQHRDLRIQTPYYPEALEARLANVTKLARTTVEETGSNFLHLVFGFLEWYEDDESDKAHHSPLYIISVSMQKAGIDRETNTYQYGLTLDNEEIQFNASLAARLKDDFGFALPEVGQNTRPEEYLKDVASVIKQRFPRWKVQRWSTITLLNFSRLLMYRDLDPDNWPRDRALDKHSLVEAVIAGESKAQNQSGETSPGRHNFDPEHEIDTIPDIHEKFPLVDVADSSQHSALIDALQGKNLVIQGPPGTGKSQTITNLIAAALNIGKTVLFVSEKMAALEVVSQRINRLGLGNFCLELHSHTTQKMGVMESLKRRVEAQFPSPRELGKKIAYHTELRDKLGEHVRLVNKPWENTGMSIHQILTRVVRFRADIPEELSTLRVQKVNAKQWDPVKQATLLRELRIFHGLVRKISDDINSTDILVAHPWRGFTATDLDADSVREVTGALRRWKESLSDLSNYASTIKQGAGDDCFPITISGLKLLSSSAFAMPSPEEGVFWEALPIINQTSLAPIDAELSTVSELMRESAATGKLGLGHLLEFHGLEKMSERIAELLSTGMSSELSVPSFFDLRGAADSILTKVRIWRDHLAEFAKQIMGETPEFLCADKLSVSSLRILNSVVQISSQLPVEYLSSRNRALLPPELKSDFEEFKLVLNELKDVRTRLTLQFNLAAAKNFEDLESLATHVPPCSLLKRILSSRYRRARKILSSVLVDKKSGWNPKHIQEDIEGLNAYLKMESAFAQNSRWRELFGEVFQSIDTDLDTVEFIVWWHSLVWSELSMNLEGLFQDRELTEAGHWVLESSSDLIQKLRAFERAGLSKDLESLDGSLKSVAWAYGLDYTPDTALLSSNSDLWVSRIQKIRDHASDLSKLDEVLAVISRSTPLGGAQECLQSYLEILSRWARTKNRYGKLNRNSFGGGLPTLPYPPGEVREAIRPTRAWISWFQDTQTHPLLAGLMLTTPTAKEAQRIKEWSVEFNRILEKETLARRDFVVPSGLDMPLWCSGEILQQLISRALEALSAHDLLTDFINFLGHRKLLEAEGLKEFCSDIEKHHRTVETYSNGFQHAVHTSLAEEILSKEPRLRRFNGIGQEEAQRDFVACDKEVLKLMSQKIASIVGNRDRPQGVRGARVSEHTEMELLQNELAKQIRHLPIRQLLNRAGRVVQALKPCFMMGPRSVAQYLAPEGLCFDLLVIDEASQMRPSDALGAVARCKQLVVVGDSKQLAPTTFFDQIAHNEDQEEEETYETAISQSILDAVAPIFTSRQLRWHYRSKHESLIAFSNHSFYDDNLMLFPSPQIEQGEVGIGFIHIPEGFFQNQTNPPEATKITDRIEELLLKYPTLSLGIATMNAKQRDLIDRLIEERAKQSPAFGEALQINSTQSEPYFVKNLENVQGDEREVMLISCTYGKDPVSGRIFQRFGPINSADGWRRLNVLFTRSRTRMEIFSSMYGSEILIEDKSSRGLIALRGMLQYAESKKLHAERPSGKEPDSDFEIAVAAMLSQHGFETDCQVGVSGFFIDLAVKSSDNSGKYLMGIECDGATYHSGKSARDRDRLRQEILEKMGWKIHRIWSTDWYANSGKALGPILTELKNMRAAIEPANHEDD